MSLDHAVSSDPGEQVRDCQTSRAPDGGFTTVATSVQTQDYVKPGSPQLMFSGRRQSSLSRAKLPPAAMPRMNLTPNIPLHSPTPIVGTPFDVNANFEYPFPPDQDHPSSLSGANIPSPAPRPPSTGSHHLLSSSPPPHMAKSISPPPVSANYTYSPAHPKMRPREPPIPPGLITKRRRMSESRSASASSDAIGDVSLMGWDYLISRSADSLPEQSSSGLRERKEREVTVIGDRSVDLSRNVRINEAEAVDAAANGRRENERRHGDNTPVPSGSSSQATLKSEK